MLLKLRLITPVILVALMLSACTSLFAVTPGTPIRVVIVGLVHDHARGLFGPLAKNPNVKLVGISEPDTALQAKYIEHFHLDQKLFYTDMDKMLDEQHPDAVLVYTDILDHRKVIEAAARRGIPSMVEKPLATNIADALAIRKAAREHHVEVLVNYETTWYSSNAEAIREVNEGKLGTIRRVVVHDGHEGPKEIGVSSDFLNWLTDPVKNGAGAMFDFGCYGADLMTVLTHGETPVSVTAVALIDKPDIYPHVDDDATIIVRYKGAQAVLQPSWAWSFARKDMEVYGDKGLAVTEASDHMRARYVGEKTEAEVAVPPLATDQQSSLNYLAAVLHGEIHPDGDLSSLKTNMIVMQILDAAHESAKTGRTIELKPLPE
ncbi:MAG TPA: Gfo/Idh/MocA family oxidoreductase [Acidobacteriaceae bacterium]|nr:Gfo/Idh/MocA family oxidoreductase [Acidobacteriaceae bacterium]